MNKKQVIRLNESQLSRIVKESVKRVLNEDIDMGQISSYSDKEDRKLDRANFENRPEIIAARKELRRLRNLIDDIESEGGDITPITQKLRNISDHYFDGNYIWHLQRGDNWDDSTGWSN